MRNAVFNAYKSEFRAIIRKVLAESEHGRLDEAGFPAYSHPNPLINWLFWQRLRKVMQYIQHFAPYTRVLDFGCGSGVMLPFLSGISRQVTALDVDLGPLERVGNLRPFPANIEIFNAQLRPLQRLRDSSFDLIVALDVLEHVDDLPATLAELQNLLAPGGRMVISGPTENLLYKIGRALAGPEYSGDYHERGIGEVRQLLAGGMRVTPIALLYWPVPLFDIFAAQA